MFLETKKKMFPIINRGTWTRVFAVREIIKRFINSYKDSEGPIQILSLGAGYDTNYFWIKDLIKSGVFLENLG
jgi:hypothetical protein